MQNGVEKPIVVFGVNSMFAVRHILPGPVGSIQRRGLRAVILSPPGEPDNDLPDTCPGAELRAVPLKREISVFSDLLSVWRIFLLLRTIRPAITDMSTPKMALVGGLASWLARVPRRIYTLRGLRYETTRSWKRILLLLCERIACACAHQVICISRSVREQILLNGIAPASKLTVLGDRVSEGIAIPDLSEPRPSAVDALRVHMGVPEGALVIGFVGRLTKDKGLHELAECFQILRREGLPVRLLLLGIFEDGDPVDERVAAWLRTDPDVHWLGYVPHPYAYYELMDVFVFPTHREGLGKVLLEAAAAGKPVVSTRTTGVIDVVMDGLTGILVPPGDSDALARATGKLLRNPGLAETMGRAAQHLVREHYDNTIYLERFGMVLESLSRGDPVPAFKHE